MSGTGDEEIKSAVTLEGTLKETRGDDMMTEEENLIDITDPHTIDADHTLMKDDEQGQEMDSLFGA